MGYLDNSSITVDAVLTKKGRELLKDSGAVGADGVPVGGGLNITSFTLSDTGVDYSLFNTSHPSGSAFYGEAIENLPICYCCSSFDFWWIGYNWWFSFNIQRKRRF